MVYESNPGLVPVGYTALSKLIDSAIKAIYGPWAIAPIEGEKRTPGDAMPLEDGSRPLSVKRTIVRAGLEIPSAVDEAIRHSVCEHIREALGAGVMAAYVKGLNDKDSSEISQKSWDRPQLVFDTGLCDRLDDAPEYEGRAVFVADSDVADFIAWCGRWSALFNEVHWPLEQALAWVLSGSPEVVREASPYRMAFREDRPMAKIDGQGVVILMALHRWPERFSYEGAKVELMAALRNSRITATGRFQGRGERVSVPADFWNDAGTFYWDGDGAATVGRLPHDSAPYWTDLLFPSAAIRDIWDSVLPEGVTTPMKSPAKSRRSRGRPKGTGIDDSARLAEMRKMVDGGDTRHAAAQAIANREATNNNELGRPVDPDKAANITRRLMDKTKDWPD